MHRTAVALASLLSLVGCGSLETPAADAPAAPPTFAAPALPQAPPEGSQAPATCKEVTTDFVAEADTVIFASGVCDGANTFGDTNGLNAYAGAAIFRFKLDLDSAKAFARSEEHLVKSVSIVLLTETNCETCGPSGLATMAGQIEGRAMRSDWDEGTKLKTGADACRRIAATATTQAYGWGKDGNAPGPQTPFAPIADYDDVAAGTRSFAAGATQIVLDLSADAIESFRNRKGEGGSNLVSVYVKSSAQIVLAAKESDKPAHLRVTRCE